jgi:hypothetical protein
MLQADRPTGFGLGYIPATSVITYMKQVEGETDGREIDRAIRFVHAIDSEYIAFQSEKADKEAGKP